MFELHQYEPGRHERPPAAPPADYPPSAAVSHNSLLVWGEHCIECAAPACYSTCDLYDARPDGRCRRLAFGAYPNSGFPTVRGYGVEVVFRKWGKLEARGNASMWPVGRTLRLEKWLGAGSRVADALGRVAARLTGDRRFGYASQALLEKLSRRLHARRDAGVAPEAFVLELYNPGGEAISLQLYFGMALEWRQQRPGVTPPSFRTTVRIPSGYSRHEFDYAVLKRVMESGPFDVSLTPEAESEAHLVVLTADFVRFAARRAAQGSRPDIKCVVWDLDNTLWEGVLLEGAPVTPNRQVLDLLHHLDQRGILLSIASKNDYESTWPKLVELGIDQLFLYPQINWCPKSESIQRIARSLNIGLDTFAFVDDNLFELEEAASRIPELTCVPAGETGRISADPRFQGSTSGESAMRRKLYQEALVREEEETRFGTDYLGFLANCAIRLEIDDYGPEDFERAAELVQRTNQLNFSGRKYTRAELRPILEDPTRRKYVLRCSDKYGSYGTVGFGIATVVEGVVRVEDFMLSCRVQGKFIEQAFFAWLALESRSGSRLWVNYTETPKNKPARKVLETIGFTPSREGRGVEFADAASLRCDFIGVAANRARV